MLRGCAHPATKIKQLEFFKLSRPIASTKGVVVSRAFAADLGRGRWSRQGLLSAFIRSPASTTSSATAIPSGTAVRQLQLADDSNARNPDVGAVADTATSEAPFPPDPDALLDRFVAAFALPRQQLRMVLERQPALQRADPTLLAQRMAAYSRATGLDTYQILYMAARQPTFLRLSPAALRERCEALAKGLALGLEDMLRLVVSQPAFLEELPDSLRAVSGRVAGELGVRPGAALRMLARLPPGELRAVLGRQQQPGQLRERLAGLRRLLLRAFGPARATRMAALLLVTRCPLLLALPTKFVQASLAALMSIPPTKGAAARSAAASAGGGASGASSAAAAGGRPSRGSVLRALLACPYILTLPPETLRGRFVMLAAATRIDMPAVVSMLLLQPRLLLLEPASVRERLEGLTFSLMVPRSAALDMVVRQPQLLLYRTDTLAENWAALQQLLGVTFDSALSIVTRRPNLLCMSQSRLGSKLAALEVTFALPRPRAVMLVVEKPQLLTMSEAAYQAAHRVLAPLLALPTPAALGRLVCREPYLLTEDTVKLTAKVTLAASLLGISEAQVGSMLARSPHFITKELSFWQTNLDTITGGLGVSVERARKVAAQFPLLLAAEPTVLLRVAAANMALVRSDPAWLSLLEELDSKGLFNCLVGFNNSHREHLQYVVDAGLQSQLPFLHNAIWDRTEFVKRFPRFADWQAERRAVTTARNGLPLPRGGPVWPPTAAAATATAGGLRHAAGASRRDSGSWEAIGGESGLGTESYETVRWSTATSDKASASARTAAANSEPSGEGPSASRSQQRQMWPWAEHRGVAGEATGRWRRRKRRRALQRAGLRPAEGEVELEEVGLGAAGVEGVAAGVAPALAAAAAAPPPAPPRRRPLSRRRRVRRMPILSSTDE